MNLATSVSNVGAFSEAKKINNLIFSVINAAFNALSPRMSYHASRGEMNKVSYYFEKGLYNSALFSVIIVSGILATAPDFVDFFYGDGYQAVTNVLRMLGLPLTIIPVIALLNNGILIPLKKDKNYLVSILIILIFGIIFNLILDPYFGAVGAAASYLLSQLLSLIYLGFICRKIIKPLQILSTIILTFILIIGNTLLINSVSQSLIIENSVISFIVKGFLSVLVSTILLGCSTYLLKMKKTSKNF
ncbi:lipopolysaccharide biosynthesis protein [Aerococcus viridans]|uniref:lipopolysaccharide biosynthesis protein n=1 Tax=Aerococcus viridans TaxID=1377 RepID=UPI003AA8FEB1